MFNYLLKHKFVAAASSVAIGGSVYILDHDRRDRLVDKCVGHWRTFYFMTNIAYILFSFKHSFRNVEHGTPEYESAFHEVNERLANRAYHVVTRLGGYYVKFGQAMSTMQDIVPEEWLSVMKQCQDKCVPVPFSKLSRVIREDMGVDESELFAEISETPIGAASLAQVHKGRLKTGEEVAIKIQYPHIRKYTIQDLKNLHLVTVVVNYLFPSVDFRWYVDRFQGIVIEEIDFCYEAQNTIECKEFFKNQDYVYVPCVYEKYSSNRILVMEYVDGIKGNDFETMKKEHISSRKVCQMYVHAFSDMMFSGDFLHVDPHPGNLLIRRNSKVEGGLELVLLDHGMYHRFQPGFGEIWRKAWLGMVSQNKNEINSNLGKLGIAKFSQILTFALTGRGMDSNRRLGEKLSREEMEQVRAQFIQPLSIGSAVEYTASMSEMMKELPPDMVLILRTVMLMQGYIAQLGCSESERLQGMTWGAIRRQYALKGQKLGLASHMKWKWYLLLLRIKISLMDWWSSYIIRYYLGRSKTNEYSPEKIFGMW